MWWIVAVCVVFGLVGAAVAIDHLKELIYGADEDQK